MKKLLLVLLIIAAASLKSYSQTFYTVDGGLRRVTLSDKGCTYVDIKPYCGTGGSIAIFKNYIYYDAGSQIWRGKIVGNTVIDCEPVGPNILSGSVALTVNPRGILYYALGNRLAKLDPVTKKSELVGDMFEPAASDPTGTIGGMPLSASGDLAFFNNELYMAAINGIAKVNLANTKQSKLIIPSSLTIFGLANVLGSDGKIHMYATVLPGTGTALTELDLVNNKFGAVGCTLPFVIGDAASDVESGTLPRLEPVITEECNNLGKGHIEITNQPTDQVVNYTLGAVTNTTGTFSNLNPGKYTIRAIGKSDTLDIEATVPDFNAIRPKVTFTTINPKCEVKGEVTFKTTGDPANYKIKLDTVEYQFNTPIRVLSAGTTRFTILKANGCFESYQDVTVTQDKCEIIIKGVNVARECDSVRRGSITVDDKPHFYTHIYTLLSNGKTNTTGVFNYLQPGTYQIKITSPEDEELVSATIPDYKLTDPTVTFTTVKPKCEVFGQIQFAMTGGDTSQYKLKLGGKEYSFSHTFKDLYEGRYVFSLMKNGCIIEYEDVLVEREKCEIIVKSVDVARECDKVRQGYITVDDKPHAYVHTYTLLSTGENNTVGVFHNLQPGTYQIKITSIEDEEQVQATVPDYKLTDPVVTASVKSQVCDIGGKIKFDINAVSTLYKVMLNGDLYSLSHTFMNMAAADYFFTVLDAKGCILDTMHVLVKTEGCQAVTFPTGFTPNNDGINDLFRADPRSRASQFVLTIYNRFGDPVFRTTDLQHAWNGESNGKPAPTGVYYWIVTYRDENNKPVTQKGNVTLMR